MLKIKRIWKYITAVILIVALMAVALLSMGNASSAHAVEATDGVEAPAETPTEPQGGGELQTLVDGFLAQLKAKYGDEYETYYNAIIAKWGSVEAYLLSLVDDGTIPDIAASGWRAFVKWLGDYAPIWGSILAVLAVIILVVFGKKLLHKLADYITGYGGKFKTLFASINKLYNAHIAQEKALVKLLGENERLKAERDELETSIKEMQKDEYV